VVFAAVNPDGYAPMRSQRGPGALVALIALTIGALALVRLDPGVLCALPAIVLPVLLALRRYPGERILTVLSRARRERPERSRSGVPSATRWQGAVPRGGLLLACSLADRPPPSASLAAS
jgi:hypothetical protein